MDDKESIKMNTPAKASKETEESIKRGQEAIEAAKKTDPDPADQKEKDKKEEQDAEKWRNEG